MSFEPRFTVTNAITAALTRIERARGFLEAAKLSEDWIRRMGERALVLEAHHTTHIEWLNAPGKVHPVLASGAAQFQLVYIHPFLDGNGRSSRLLSTL